MRSAFSVALLLIGMAATTIAKGQEVTKATFTITGLHCPPCTRTVESSLAGAKGVSSVKVDWKTKSAKIAFDEAITSVQKVAGLVASTRHMMGGRKRYAAQLALSVPEVKDDASANTAKAALSAMQGIESVATFPQQHTVSVRFSGEGNVTSRDLVAALEKAELKASVYQ